MQRIALVTITATLVLGLGACGGGGSGGSPNFIPRPPAPPPAPPAPPSTLPVPPLPAGSIGLQSAAPFATVSASTDGWGTLASETGAVQIAYSAADDRYTLTLPGYEEGQYIPKGGNGSFNETGWIKLHSTYGDLTLGAGPATQDVAITLDWPRSSEFTFTSFGSWQGSCPMGCPQGVFAYGIPTAVGDVPVQGSASYDGEIRGLTADSQQVFGTVFLSFNFGAGTLSGEMKPEYAPHWDAISLGTYTFRDTVYSTGSTTFSGAFNVPGSNGPSSFSGSFTGPNAAELMARWQAPFVNPLTNQESTMAGVWIAKTGE